jgi:tetratricopeptide (TPR) repeat protein
MGRLLFFLSVWLTFSGWAGTPDRDSLYAVVNNPKLADTARINALYNLASKIHLYSSPDSAFYYADRMEVWAQQINKTRQVARARMIKGVASLFLGKTEDAERFLNESANLASGIQDHETVAFATYNLGAVAFSRGDYFASIDYFRRTSHAYEANGDLKLAVGVNNNIGAVHSDLGNLDSSLYYFNECIRLSELSDDKKGKAAALLNIGTAYKNMGDLQRAMEYFDLNIRTLEELEGLSPSIVVSYNQKAILFQILDDFDSAEKLLNEAWKIAKQISHKEGEAITLSNLSSVYSSLGKYDKVIELLNQAIAIQLEIGDKKGLISSYNAASLFYIKQLELNDSRDEVMIEQLIESATLGLTVAREISNIRGETESLINVAQGYRLKGQLEKALDFAKQAEKIAIQQKEKVIMKRLTLVLAHIYRDLNRFKEAYNYFVEHIRIKEELDNEENQKAMMRITMQSEYDKQKAIDQASFDLEIEKRDELARKEREKRNLTFLFVGLILLVISIFSIFLYRRYKLTVKQKSIIEHQKELVEHKQREVMDSITYAKRIQDAILPSRQRLNETLKNGFVLFKPKDIVSGDFYWMEELDGRIYLAAADCTGHGVPGAMVSVVCSNALSKALLEEKKQNTGELLDRTRELVVARFAKSGEEVKDGMDISLVSLAHRAEKQNENENESEKQSVSEGNRRSRSHFRSVIQWSGANNPLWIVRNSEIIEIKPDKQPIGKYDNPKPFTAHEVEVQLGDKLYLFTDGIQDQFGGEKGKKLKPAKLKEWLLAVANEPMEKQKQIIDEKFEAWKHGFEQLDDVCLIGIEIV